MNSSLTQQAIAATRHCLTGCAIGEVLGMVVTSGFRLGTVAAIVVSIVLAFVFGYALTLRGLLRSGTPLRHAARLTLAADTVSIATMELSDNAFILIVPGAVTAGLNTWLFWVSLATSLVVAFVVTVPVNRWLIQRGLGHALVHHH